jgi:predicted amidohydrolase
MGGTILPEPFSQKGIALNELKVAALQMCSSQNKAENLRTAERLLEEAARKGADFACLPERFNFYGPRQDNAREAETIPGETCRLLQGVAKKAGINIIGGSILEKIENSDKFFNTSMIIGRKGDLIGLYRKIHLFDINSAELVSYDESSEIEAGDEVGFFPVDGLSVGVAICYDLRFPELFRLLAVRGAEIIFLPSAFSRQTGELHWEILVRARAIENQAYVIAVDQCGVHPGQPESFADSLMVGPQGEVLERLGQEEGIAVAELNLGMLRRIRAEHPALATIRREFLGIGIERQVSVSGKESGR